MKHQSRLVTLVSTAIVLLGSVALTSDGFSEQSQGCRYQDMTFCPIGEFGAWLICHDYAEQEHCSYSGEIAWCVNNPLEGGTTLACCTWYC